MESGIAVFHQIRARRCRNAHAACSLSTARTASFSEGDGQPSGGAANSQNKSRQASSGRVSRPKPGQQASEYGSHFPPSRPGVEFTQRSPYRLCRTAPGDLISRIMPHSGLPGSGRYHGAPQAVLQDRHFLILSRHSAPGNRWWREVFAGAGGDEEQGEGPHPGISARARPGHGPRPGDLQLFRLRLCGFSVQEAPASA